MIPLSLSLRNFMCYRELPTLDLEGLHVACLCGNNGHGKSALLDAMTWALWGRARGRATLPNRSSIEEELVHLGQRDMEVALTFRAQGQTYRVIRKYTKGPPAGRRIAPAGPRGTSLELHLLGEQGVLPLTGNSVDETQARLIEVLRLDYDTFINSAFLLQGRADEFTRKTPAERKRILGEVLGISLYAELEEAARARHHEVQRLLDDARGTLKALEDQLAGRDAYQQQLLDAGERLATIDAQLAQQSGKLAALQQSKAYLERKGSELEAVRKAVAQAGEELQRLETQQAAVLSRARARQELLQAASQIEAGFSRWQKVLHEHEALNERLAQYTQLAQEKAPLAQAIERARAELVTNQRWLSNTLAQKATATRRLPEQRVELKKAQAALDSLAQREEQAEAQRQRLQDLAASLQSLKAEETRRLGELQDVQSKAQLLDKGDARCPLCQQELGQDARDHISKEYQEQLRQLRADLQNTQAQLREATAQYNLLARQAPAQKTQLEKERSVLFRQTAALEHGIQEGEKAVVELDELGSQLQVIEERLAKQDYARVEQQAVGAIEARIGALAYDPTQHDRVRQQVHELQVYDNQHRELELARRMLPQEREDLERLRENRDHWNEALQREQQRQVALNDELGAWPQLIQALQQADQELQELERSRQSWDTRQAQAGALLAHLEEVERQKQELEKRLAQLSREAQDYQTLAEAFGKNGMQAWLIDEALPELEAEANDLLARMTDGAMSVKLETQRETRRGETVETLDIRISDGLGARSYELYSGGESFRIDFALRIALSRLLARRAGAPLPTLFIDEGFGTQDAPGRDRLLEALRAIQDDFQLILVITHIEELKEAFPIRIEVSKTAEGSVVRMT